MDLLLGARPNATAAKYGIDMDDSISDGVDVEDHPEEAEADTSIDAVPADRKNTGITNKIELGISHVN